VIGHVPEIFIGYATPGADQALNNYQVTWPLAALDLGLILPNDIARRKDGQIHHPLLVISIGHATNELSDQIVFRDGDV
jgi:hypothetical protein